MIDAEQFGTILKGMGYNFYSGVPCSFLKDLINYAINQCNYVAAANEGDAIATAAGAYLGGQKAVAIMQNSGLTNATSPLTSLTYTFRIPVLGFVTLRGEPGISDEPQHELMGTITERLLEEMQIAWEYLSTDISEAKVQVERADKLIQERKSFFFVVKKGTFNPVALAPTTLEQLPPCNVTLRSTEEEVPSRLAVLEHLCRTQDKDTVHVATTGKTGRELFEAGDCERNLYMVGSMGCASALTLGMAMSKPLHRFVAIDGDGALLMRTGVMATNAYYRPPNMLHLLLDNNVHDSTGGQDTVSHNVDFVSLAAAFNYPNARYIHSITELDEAIADWKNSSELTFLYLKIQQGSKANLGRPTVPPHQVAIRLQEYLQ